MPGDIPVICYYLENRYYPVDMRRSILLFLFVLLQLKAFPQKVCGRVTACSGGEAIAHALIRIGCSNGSIYGTMTDSLGAYTYPLKNGLSYIILVYAPTGPDRYDLNRTTYFNLPDRDKKRFTVPERGDTTIRADFCLPKGSVCGFRFPSPAFTVNSAVPQPDTAFVRGNTDRTFTALVEVLEDNPSVVIEIAGHADSTETNPEALSGQRAQAVADSLAARGIAKERLRVQGYGALRPLTMPDGTRLTETYINTQPAEERKSLRNLNRRAVIRVVAWDYKGEKKGG